VHFTFSSISFNSFKLSHSPQRNIKNRECNNLNHNWNYLITITNRNNIIEMLTFNKITARNKFIVQ
jgi:hypothetical protein